MIELKGKYNTAKVFTDNMDEKAMGQVIELLNEEFSAGSSIRVMPDTHAGAGCVIGTTMTIGDKVVPNLVGVDIGCGMLTVELGKIAIKFEALDNFIRNNVPHGFNAHEDEREFPPLEELRCKAQVNMSRAKKSIGSLGGGNHFIEVNEDSKGSRYLVIHSGSRYLGLQVAKYYQDLAYSNLTSTKDDRDRIVEELKAQGREKEIHQALRGMKAKKVNKDLAYLEGQDLEDYLHDMDIAQRYAVHNRIMMMNDILAHLNLNRQAHIFFSTIHNYIDTETRILRKGAISAKAGELVLIPINMRDGSILAVGKGNPDWNYSAPHGAGRLFSRGKAKETFNLEDYKETMKDIYTTSVTESTLDECPMAYKPIEEIIENTKDAVEILDIIRPLYNFKA